MRVMSGAEMGVVACGSCGAIGTLPRESLSRRCARCESRVERRRPRSVEHSLAWLLAGLLCYVPANTLPVMYTSGIGGGQNSTILSGVLGFWRAGDWGVALIIFLASVVVPAAKFIGVGLLLWTVHAGKAGNERARGKFHRAIEFIGYWSMLDVAVVALTAALLQFESLGRAEPRIGIAFFCATVVFTMLSALSFDSRLIWDGPQHDA